MNVFMKYILVFVALCLAQSVSGQTFNQFKKAAEESFLKGDYYSASYYFEQANEQKPDRGEILYQWGEAARLFNAPQYALDIFSKIKKSDRKQFPKLNWSKAKCFFMLGDLDKAAETLTLKKGFNQSLKKEYEQLNNQIQWAKQQNRRDDIIAIDMPIGINSAWSDTAPFPTGAAFFFSALKYENQEKNIRLGRVYEYNHATKKQKKIDLKEIDETYHWSNWKLGLDKKTAYFTLCNPQNDNQCTIYRTEKVNEKWSRASEMPTPINAEQSSNSHPFEAIWKNEKVLFFSSNRAGGQGGFDIWYVHLYEDGTISEALNMSQINTVHNEVTPFFDGNEFYFSSERELGFGGYDIYKWDGINLVENVGLPLNSGFDDIHFFKDKENVYLSSNRIDSEKLDKKSGACCHDIFHFRTKSKPKDKEKTNNDIVSSNRDSLLVESEKKLTSIEMNEEVKKKTVSISKAQIKIQKEAKELVITGSKLEKYSKIKGKPKVYKKAVVYFDNDFPKKANTRKEIRDYGLLYRTYKNRKEVFGEKSSQSNRQRVELFFENDLELGKEALDAIIEEALVKLETGIKVELILTGFTSPRAKDDYNWALSERRINSVVNYLELISQGVLKKYLSSKLLTIKHNPRGETTASKTISDKITDKLGSIFSIEASLERRVEVEIAY